MKKKIDFIQTPINQLIITLSIPSFLAIIMNLLYGFIDGIFIGQGIGSLALGGVTIVFPLTVLAIAFASLIGEGLSSLVARLLVKNDSDTILASIRTAHGVTLLISAIIVSASFLFMTGIITGLGATKDIYGYAIDYYRAVLPGLPFMALSLVYFHQLNAHGEMRIAMEAMILSTLTNIFLDWLAIYPLKLGVTGAGYATSISQVIWYGYMHTRALSIQHIYTVPTPFTLDYDLKQLRQMIIIGFSSFLRQAGVSIAMILINTQASRYGTSVHISAFGATQRIFRLLIAPIAAINLALKPIIGHNFGVSAYKRIKTALSIAFRYCLIIGTILLGFIFFASTALGTLFGIESSDMTIFRNILLLTCCLFPLYGLQHLSVSYFTALGKAKEAIWINLFKQIIFLLPLVLLLPKFVGIYGLYMALPIADLMSMVVAMYLLRRDLRLLV